MWAGLRRTLTWISSCVGAPGRGFVARPGGHGEGLRRTRGWLLGHSWAPTLSRESVVNVGTVLVPPVRPASRVGGGKARRQLMASVRGGAVVVVRGRESRSHGQGRQQVRSGWTGRSGGRRGIPAP